MLRYLVRRSLYTLLILLVSSIAIFYSLRFAPGDPTGVTLNPLTAEEARAALRERLGLNQPVYLQYLVFLGNLLRGNFGVSLVNGTPMLDLLLSHGRNSLVLGLSALVVSYVVAIPLGVLAAVKRNTWLDQAITFFAVMAMGIPNFWLALLLIYLFSSTLRWLPSAGCCELRHLVLPVLVLAAEGTAVTLRMMRSSMLEHLRQDFVRTLRAKGLAERLVIGQHVLRNALVPIVSLAGLRLGWIIGYTLIVETVFRWPGVGYLLVDSVLRRDYPVAQFFSLVLMFCVVVANWLADITYGLVNPRIRHA